MHFQHLARSHIGALALILVLVGCGIPDRPDPPPVAYVAIAADGTYLLDGRQITAERLDRDLLRRAADAPNEKLGRTRLQVHISFAPGAWDRAQELQVHCQALGISQVEIQR
ncbi:MAG: hypothetical protein AAB263_20550 [Planctomycetota bacterium]